MLRRRRGPVGTLEQVTSDGTPPGWYPDPWQPSAWRWWDGSAWSASAGLADPAARRDGLDVAAEERAARRARLALAWAIPLQVLTHVALRAQFVDIIDVFRHLDNDSRDSVSHTASAPAAGLAQVGQVGLLVVGVLFLVWFHRSCVNARALGLPSRREPGLAVAGFVIPIVNLWWPYQSTRDLFPPGHAVDASGSGSCSGSSAVSHPA